MKKPNTGLTIDEAALRLTIPKGALGNWVSAARRGTGPKAAPGSRTVAELEDPPAKDGSTWPASRTCSPASWWATRWTSA